MRVLVVALVVLLAVSASAETEHSSVSAMVSAALKGAAFKIKKNPAAAQPFHFTAVAGNHEVVLTSESYTDLAGAQNGVESVIAHAGLRQNIQPGQAKDGKPYFTVKADNNKVIGVSETYSSAAAAQKGADALHAIVKDVTNSIAQSIPVTKGKSESSKKAASSSSKTSSKTTSKKPRFGSKTGSGIAPSEAAKKQESGKSKKSVKAGHFQIIQTTAGFHYVIKGANGEIVAQSEVYPTKQNVQAGVGAALRACGVKENLNVEKSESAGKGFFVNCKAENNQKLFNTEIYTRAATGEDAVTVLQNAVRATIGRYVKVLPVSITKSESGSKAESSGARRLESSVKKVIGK